MRTTEIHYRPVVAHSHMELLRSIKRCDHHVHFHSRLTWGELSPTEKRAAQALLKRGLIRVTEGLDHLHLTDAGRAELET